MVETMQKAANSIGMHHPALATTWEEIGAALDARNLAQQIDYWISQRNNKFLPHLHTLGR
ncbi:hypothetical protein D3C78_1975590 [compost metagenome]